MTGYIIYINDICVFLQFFFDLNSFGQTNQRCEMFAHKKLKNLYGKIEKWIAKATSENWMLSKY